MIRTKRSSKQDTTVHDITSLPAESKPQRASFPAAAGMMFFAAMMFVFVRSGSYDQVSTDKLQQVVMSCLIALLLFRATRSAVRKGSHKLADGSSNRIALVAIIVFGAVSVLIPFGLILSDKLQHEASLFYGLTAFVVTIVSLHGYTRPHPVPTHQTTDGYEPDEPYDQDADTA